MENLKIILSTINKINPSEVERVADENGHFILLGQGSFVDVFHGIWKKSDGTTIPVALKFIHSIYSFNEQEIWHQIDIMNRFDHENICKVYGYYNLDDKESKEIVLVMEFIDPPRNISPNVISTLIKASNLSDFLLKSQDTKFDDLSFKLHLMMQASKVLQHIHSKKIIHRNLKAKNFLIDSEFKLKLGDFGLATLFDVQHELLVPSQKETLRFMAPEVINNPSIYSYSSDIFDLGLVFFEILERKNPFNSSVVESLGSYMYHNFGKPELSFEDKYPTQLKELLQRMWNRDRYQRPSIQQILWQLQDIKEHLASHG